MLRHANAFSGYSVRDIEEAKRFYNEVLGLDVTENSMGILEINLTGLDRLILYPKNDHTPATFTVLNFSVDNIEAAVDELASAGIQFEQYTAPIQTDAKGICRNEDGPYIAWFKDPSGNILSVIQERSGM